MKIRFLLSAYIPEDLSRETDVTAASLSCTVKKPQEHATMPVITQTV